MTPAITPLVSALERAATLIDRGMKSSIALRQVAKELVEHDRDHAGRYIEQNVFPLGSDPVAVPKVVAI